MPLLTVEEVHAGLSALTDYSFANFLSIDSVSGEPIIDFEKAQSEGAFRVIKKFTIDRSGKITIELYSILDIYTAIMRLHGISTTGRYTAAAGTGEFTGEDIASLLTSYMGGDDEDDLDLEDGDGF